MTYTRRAARRNWDARLARDRTPNACTETQSDSRPLGEMADAGDLKSFAARHAGSSPAGATKKRKLSPTSSPLALRRAGALGVCNAARADGHAPARRAGTVT